MQAAAWSRLLVVLLDGWPRGGWIDAVLVGITTGMSMQAEPGASWSNTPDTRWPMTLRWLKRPCRLCVRGGPATSP